MRLRTMVPLDVEAKELRIHCKVCDNFTAHVVDDQGRELGGQDDGYVPGFMPGDHYGDYLILNIDIDTGMITNWKRPDPKDVRAFIAGEKDE